MSVVMDGFNRVAKLENVEEWKAEYFKCNIPRSQYDGYSPAWIAQDGEILVGESHFSIARSYASKELGFESAEWDEVYGAAFGQGMIRLLPRGKGQMFDFQIASAITSSQYEEISKLADFLNTVEGYVEFGRKSVNSLHFTSHEELLESLRSYDPLMSDSY